MTHPSQPTDSPLRLGLIAARRLLPAGSILIAFAFAILIGYYYVPPVTAFLDRIAELKASGGLILPILSTAMFGGVLPTLFQQAIPATRTPTAWRRMPFFTVFWAYKGFEIDMLYKFADWAFGSGVDIGTVMAKVAFDQFVFSLFWAVPWTVVIYALPEAGYRVGDLPASLGPRWVRNRVVPLLIANYFVWIPAVVVIYSLKLPLQLPIQNIILCLWAILVLLMVHRPVSRPRDMVNAAV